MDRKRTVQITLDDGSKWEVPLEQIARHIDNYYGCQGSEDDDDCVIEKPCRGSQMERKETVQIALNDGSKWEVPVEYIAQLRDNHSDCQVSG